MPDDSAHQRAIPRQQRSLATWGRILDHADRLFAERGYDAVTTNHIAEAAGVAVGSLYRFFPNKDSLLHALIARYRDRLSAVFPTAIAPPRPIADVLTEMLDNLITFQGQQRGIDWMLTRVEPSEAGAIAGLHGSITAWVEALLTAHFPTLGADARRRCALTGVAIISGMVMLLAPPTLSESAFREEAHTALLGYLERFLRQQGIALN